MKKRLSEERRAEKCLDAKHRPEIAVRLQSLTLMYGTQTEVAAAAGIERKRWNNIIKSGKISRELLILLHHRLGLSADWVLFGTGRRRSST